MLPEVHPGLQSCVCSLYSLYCLGLKCFCCSGQMQQYRGGKIVVALKCVWVASVSEFSNFVHFIHFYLIVVLTNFIKDGLTKASFPFGCCLQGFFFCCFVENTKTSKHLFLSSIFISVDKSPALLCKYAESYLWKQARWWQNCGLYR